MLRMAYSSDYNVYIHILEQSWSVRSWSLLHCGAVPGYCFRMTSSPLSPSLSLSLSLCELWSLSGVLLWWNAVPYFHGVPSFPLPASSASTSLSDGLHRMPFNSPLTIGPNFLCSAKGLCVGGESGSKEKLFFVLFKWRQKSHLQQYNGLRGHTAFSSVH